ncbi:MAG: hypothetical protein ABR581_07905 [Thermoleophilaceae bacterium]
MAILTTFKVKGDPDELYRTGMEKIEPEITEVATRNGALARVIVKEDDGLLFFHLWENEEGMRKTAEEMGGRIREEDFPPQEGWQQLEVLHHATQAS